MATALFPVALLRAGDDPAMTVARLFELLGPEPDLAARAGSLVTIKVNLTAPRPSGSGVVTDVRVVAGFVRLLRARGYGGRIVVADGPGMAEAARCFEVAGYRALADEGVELADLNAAPTRPTPVPGWLRYPVLEIPEVVLDADLFVSITPVKTHTDGLLTLHAKNLFGVPPNRFYGRPRKALHRAGVSEVVHDISRACPIDLAITDATVCTELGDPIDGTPVPLGALAAGWNAQAVDVVGCALLGQSPDVSAYMRYLHDAGYGPLALDDVEVRGEPVASLARRFALPDPAEVAARQRTSAH